MAEPETKKTKVAEGTPKKAIITGITGQDGSYLAEFLLEKVGIRVFWAIGSQRVAAGLVR